MFSDADECSNNDHSCDVNAVCSMILWDRTHAHVKLDTQEMGGLAMVRLLVLKRSHCTAISDPWVELHKTYTLVALFQRS